jgi:carboxypeptidase C (cathepsin A)
MADAAAGEQAKDEESKADEKPKPLQDQEFTTQHSVTVDDTKVDYTANVGRIVLTDGGEQAKPKVALFYTAYIRDGVESARDRPVVFLSNGRPGSSAAVGRRRRARRTRAARRRSVAHPRATTGR